MCDFTSIEPRLHAKCKNRPVPREAPEENTPGFYRVYQVGYSKTGRAKYFAHLEMVNIIIRALRRAGIPVKYSQGFHPMPKIAFDDPLPVGIESLDERLFITVPGHIEARDILTRLAPQLPEALALKPCTLVPKKRKTKDSVEETYWVELHGGRFDPQHLDKFRTRREFMYLRRNRKGRQKSFDLKTAVPHIELINQISLEMRIRKENGATLRPNEILSQIFDLSRDELKMARVVKRAGDHV